LSFILFNPSGAFSEFATMLGRSEICRSEENIE